MLKIKKLEVTPFQQNARILYHDKSREAVVIDPGGEAKRIQGELTRLGLHLIEIWLTHSHLDHCGGAKALLELTSAKLVGHRAEMAMCQHVAALAQSYGLEGTGMENCPEPNRYVEGGELVNLGEFNFEVRFTPGHSPGHVCYYQAQAGILLGGDLVFSGSVGRTDLPGGDHEELLRSIKREVLTLPGETKILSGHGPDTTVAEEQRSNPFLQGL